VPASEIHDRQQRDDRRGHAGQSDSGRWRAAQLVRLIFGNEGCLREVGRLALWPDQL